MLLIISSLFQALHTILEGQSQWRAALVAKPTWQEQAPCWFSRLLSTILCGAGVQVTEHSQSGLQLNYNLVQLLHHDGGATC
jgi:hypothetical protein